jgi:hypothetical protein
MWKSIGEREFKLGNRFLHWLHEQVADNEDDWLPNPIDIAKSAPFVDDGQGEDDMETLLGIMLWIRTARAAGYYGGKNWIPSPSDLSKSALFERIRSGVVPLPEPPPLGFACPWYAVVEDPGPHYGYEVAFHSDGGWMKEWRKENEVSVYSNIYEIVETIDAKHFIVKDKNHDTSYRFHLWYDADWQHPSNSPHILHGGWFLQNAVFHGKTP